MGMFLNSIVPYEGYREIAGTRFFVDKTPMIDEIISSVALDGQKYLCITRPRRFGKSVMANMIGAFFERSVDGRTLFASLKIASSDKVDSTAEDAVWQIRERDYALRFIGKLGEEPKYSGRILAVGISYSRKTKEHFCRVEVLRSGIAGKY